MEKESWKKDSGYIWSMLGSAVGFANLLSFSAHCYKNGGGAFLIPYFAAMLALGIPMLVLEGTIGKKLQLPLVSAYGRLVGNWGRFLGWIAVLACATIGGFYMVLTGYSVAYTYFAAAGSIPQDTGTFFTKVFLQDSGSLAHFGSLSWPILISTLVVACFSWFVLIRKIQSGVESICSLFLPLLGLLVGTFAVAVAFLPGAWQGMIYYLKPDFSRLTDVALWRDVFGQLFFSLSLGLGIVTGYSRHTNSKTNILKAMAWVAMGDFLISFVAGFAVFGCIAYLAQASGQPFESIVKTTSSFEIGFVIFPAILQQFGPVASRILGPLFFFCVFIAGVTGVFSIVESVAGNIQVEFNKTRKAAVTITLALLSGLAIFFCMGNGPYILDALAPMVLGNNMLIGGVAEILVFMYLTKEIRDDAVWFRRGRRSTFYHSLRYLSLVIMSIILVQSTALDVAGPWGLDKVVRWSWLAVVAILSLSLARKQRAPEVAAV